jgi:hypothetical protein
MQKFTEMLEEIFAGGVVLFLWIGALIRLLPRLGPIHPPSWNKNSRKFIYEILDNSA